MIKKLVSQLRDLPTYIYILLACFIWVLPFLLIVYHSFTIRSPEGTFFVWFNNYADITEEYWRGLKTSMLLVPCVLFLDLLVATPAAYILARTKFKGRRSFFTFVTMTMFVPDVVSGLSLLIVYRTTYNLYDTFLGLVLALSIVSFPMMLIPLLLAFRALDPVYEEAASCLGANRWRVLVHIILPLIGPGIIGGSMLAFIWAINDFLLPFFVVASRYTVAAFTVYTDVRWWGMLGRVAGEAALLQFISFAFIVIYLRSLGARYLKGIVWI